MKYSLVLFVVGSAWAASISGDAIVSKDWIGDGGGTFHWRGDGMFISLETDVQVMGNLLTCTNSCDFYADTRHSNFAFGDAAINGLSSSTFTVSLSGDDTALSGMVTLLDPQTFNVIASTPVSTSVTITDQQNHPGQFQSRNFSFAAVVTPTITSGATVGGGAVIANPEPGTGMLLVGALMLIGVHGRKYRGR